MLTGINLLFRFLLLAFLALALFFVLELFQFYCVPLSISKSGIEFELKSGMSSHQIANQLQKQGVLRHSRFFVLMAHLKNSTHQLKAGEYRLHQGQTASDVMNDFINGNVFLRTVTIVPGWTIEKVLDEFHQLVYLRHDLKTLSFEQMRQKLGIKQASMEGLFWPETYSFAKNTDESDILIKAHHMMMSVLTQEWNKRDLGLMYQDPYEALIVASLVEKETALDSERPIIAGVILRRIQKNMYLQIDPTVIYALGARFSGSLSRSDLRYQSPYNTYLNKGLPPTPIAIPGLASLQAALHPDKSDVLYFVTNGNGGHVFSSTLEEHNKAVRKMREHQGRSSNHKQEQGS